MRRPPRPAGERGSAVADFVLVLLVLVPLVLGILQVALTLFVRNTLAAAASEGARYAATADRGPADGVARTREQVEGAVSGRFAREVSAAQVVHEGQSMIEVTVRATVPALGLGGPGVELEVTAHAVEENVEVAP